MTENQKLHKQYAFEDFMKTVLRNKARNIHKKLDIQEQREAAASNFDESIFDNLMTEDSYALETMMPFRVKEQVFVVTPHIGNALSYLQPKYRDVLLLSYFAEWSDSKIARYLNLPVSTVNSRRNQALQQLKRIMEHDKETIRKAANGDTQSICAVMEHFEGYINRLSMREGTDLYGEPHTYLNEDIKRELMIELIVKLPLFDCEKYVSL